MSFRVEYRRGTAGAAMFQRQVRFQVDISTVSKPSCPKEYLYAVTFTLLSGNVMADLTHTVLLILYDELKLILIKIIFISTFIHHYCMSTLYHR